MCWRRRLLAAVVRGSGSCCCGCLWSVSTPAGALLVAGAGRQPLLPCRVTAATGTARPSGAQAADAAGGGDDGGRAHELVAEQAAFAAALNWWAAAVSMLIAAAAAAACWMKGISLRLQL